LEVVLVKKRGMQNYMLLFRDRVDRRVKRRDKR
jgi:hypothetical protein